MSAELLRRAVALLRERAAATTPEDWFAAGSWLDGIPARVAEVLPAGFVGAGSDAVPVVLGVPPLDEQAADPRPNMEYIALMHPPVAAALAEWLEATAAEVDGFANQFAGGEQREGDLTETDRAAVAVARVLLRVPDGTS